MGIGCTVQVWSTETLGCVGETDSSESERQDSTLGGDSCTSKGGTLTLLAAAVGTKGDKQAGLPWWGWHTVGAGVGGVAHGRYSVALKQLPRLTWHQLVLSGL